MCGIFGFAAFYNSQTDQKRLASRLFKLSQSRGMEASGFARIKDKNILLYKAPVQAAQIIRTPQFRSCFDNDQNAAAVFIGHSRLATNGVESDNHNNQPVLKDGVVCVHNGIIVNVAGLWEKHRSKLVQNFGVDTEIIPALFRLYLTSTNDPVGAIQKTYSEIEGAASICLAPVDAGYLILATNTGSIYTTVNNTGLFVFASEEYILRQATDSVAVLHVPPGSGLLVDCVSGAQFPFSLTGSYPGNPPQSRLIKRTITDVSRYEKRFFTGKSLNSLSLLEKHQPDYRAIAGIKRCSRCIMPATMPLITFDGQGVCNFCNTYEKQNPVGETALEKLVQPYRRTDGKPDCIVALSGGRDSSYGLHYAKTVLKLNPMAFTYDWGMVTDIARRNQSRMTAKLGVEHVIVSADIGKKLENIRKNIHAWLARPDLGMVTLLMAGDKQAEFYCDELQRKTGIKLVIYCRGNRLEDERFKFGYYGIFDGTPGGVIHNLSWSGKLRMLGYYGRQFITNPKYLNSSLTDSAWAYASAYLIRHNFVYLWHYTPWDERQIISTLKRKYNWESPSDTIATWRIDDGTPPFYNYIYYHIQGFTEHDGLRSNQIREGILSRRKAMTLVNEENKPRYEALAWYFDRVGLDGDRVLGRVDSIPVLY